MHARFSLSAPAAAVAVMFIAILPLTGTPAGADDDFTFRRISARDTRPGARITVQIDPEEQARRLAATAWRDPALHGAARPQPAPSPDSSPNRQSTPGASSYAWFWDIVPPGREERSGRFPRAMAALAGGPEGARVVAPRLQSMQVIAESYGRDILRATAGTEVSPALALAVIGIESAGRANAVSHAGATGLMQLIPATAHRFGVRDATDPAENIRGGVAYLDWLLREFDRDPLMVLAAYNAGEGAVRANGGVPPYAETRDYVPKVLAAWQVARGLCLTAPELVTDPCVFRVIAAGA